MFLANAFFYLFAAVMIAASVMVISARNPVHSVLFLILAFFNAAGLFLLLGAEFLAMVLVIVYVGAVAVLFLFVVMMLDFDIGRVRHGFLQYLPVGGLVGLILLVELLVVLGGWALPAEVTGAVSMPIPPAAEVTNTEALGLVLYTHYVHFFQLAGLVLLVAMIGAIVLTLRHKEGVKRQDIAAQVARTREAAIEVRQVDSRKGI